MNSKDIIVLKEILTKELADLLDANDCSLNVMNSTEENLSDIVDIAAHTSELSFSHHLCSREKLYIRKIEKALQDIEDGGYGICQECGDDISVKRLMARPTTRHCIDCKTRMEIMGGRVAMAA